MDIQTPADKAALKKSLTAATAIMMLSVMASRVIGLARETVIANFGGTSTDIDAYVTSFFIPELLNHFLAEGFLSITFIPIFQRYLSQSDAHGGWRSFSNLITIGTVAFAVVIPISIIFTPDILRLMGPHITSAETLPLTVRLTRIILPAQIFFYWGAFFSAVQMAQHRFFLPALAPLLYNAGIILGGLVLGPRLGVEGFAWGVLAGAIAANVLVQLPGAMKVGMRYSFRFNLADPDVKKFLLLSLPLVLGLSMTFSNEVFFRYFGSFLKEGGSSSINYAIRTMGFVVAVFGQATGVAFYPYLSRLAAEKKFTEISTLLNNVLLRIATYCIPACLLLMVLAPQVISVLYEHGNFTAASTARTAPIFAIYLAGAFAFSASVFTARPFYAVQKPYIPMIVSTAISLGILPLYYLGTRAWGAAGIAVSAVCGISVQFLLLFCLWHIRHGNRESLTAFLKKIVLIAGVSILGGAVAWLIRSWIAPAGFGFGKLVDNLMVCALTGLPAGAIVLLLYQITGVQKIGPLLKAVLGKNKVGPTEKFFDNL